MKIKPEELYKLLYKYGVEFYTGVPDSTIKDFCFFLDSNLPKSKHIIAANEGNSIGIATGYHLSTGKIPLVYMQNSGFGNAINPITSLADKSVFSIPMLIMLGWRGEPETNDAIQHQKDGQIQISLIESLGIPYTILSNNSNNLEDQIDNSVKLAEEQSSPFFLLVRRNSFEKSRHKLAYPKIESDMSREYAISEIIKSIENDAAIISTTGKISRELYESRLKQGDDNHKDFRVIGSMGHASSISLGMSISNEKRKVYCIDGDGSIIMHMGALSVIGKYGSSNFRHILLNNFSHDSVGGQASSSDVIDFSILSRSLSYKSYYKIAKKSDFNDIFTEFISSPGPSFLEIVVTQGSRSDLSRPNISPIDNKKSFMEFFGD